MHIRYDGSTGALVVCAALFVSIGPSARGEEDGPRALTPKFFFYDARTIEWAVSAEPEAFQKHLEANPDSVRLFKTLTGSLDEAADTEQVRSQMARWVEAERERFGGPGGTAARFRRAEGIVAYLRAHDFSVDQLVGELLERSGAAGVELVAVHLIDAAGNASYRLKVALPNDRIGIGSQGFNVVLTSPEITYSSVVYALALALYEVHEIINADLESDGGADLDIESLPPPELGAPAEPDGDNPFATPDAGAAIGEPARSDR